MRLRDERGVTFGPIAGAVVIFLALVGAFALCNDNDDRPDTLGRVQLVDHEWGGGGYDEDNGGYGDDRAGDGRFGGGRSGDYDGGPGDDCRNLCGNTIVVPAPGGRDQR